MKSKLENPSVFFAEKPEAVFLKAVAHGNYAKVRAMLENNIQLLTATDQVTDYSGRTFKINGFKLALWALDKHMWTLMLRCIPQNAEGKALLEKLLTEYNELKENGISYTLKHQTIREKHFDFENTIIKELKTQIDSSNTPGTKDWQALDKQWVEGVGGAELLLPPHVVFEYCSRQTPFKPTPAFISQPETSTQFYNWQTKRLQEWFSTKLEENWGGSIGVDFAVYKAHRKRLDFVGGVGCNRRWLVENLEHDLFAMEKLHQVRTEEFNNLGTTITIELIIIKQSMLENYQSYTPQV